MEIMTWLWIAVCVLLVILEATTAMLVCIWFVGGSAAALIVSLCGGPVWLQVVLFFVVSGVCLVLLRPIIKKHFTPKLVKTNVDAIVGQKGYVTEDIDNIDATGQVKLGGMYWTARSVSGENIPKGTLVEVDHIEGVRAFVKVVEESKV
jgi:membrane protein implicated in regulation of membrane protease activity